MIPRPVRYRARRGYGPEGPGQHSAEWNVVEFQQGEGDRWFPLAEVVDGVPFGWGPGEHGHIEHVRHLASALLLSRVPLGLVGELVDDMTDLVLRMPPEGWEMDGKTFGVVVFRLVAKQPVPDPAAFALDIAEQRLVALFGDIKADRAARKKAADPPDRRRCECGQPLPVHLLPLGVTHSVCRCNRRYRVEHERFVPDGREHNPFANRAEVPHGQ